jgi:hypothetical protein
MKFHNPLLSSGENAVGGGSKTIISTKQQATIEAENKSFNNTSGSTNKLQDCNTKFNPIAGDDAHFVCISSETLENSNFTTLLFNTDVGVFRTTSTSLSNNLNSLDNKKFHTDDACGEVIT